jgi:hypothetical protein
MGQLSDLIGGLARVEILPGQIQKRSGTSKDGKPYERKWQDAILVTRAPNGRELASQFQLGVGRDGVVYQPGNYLIAGSSFRVSQFQDLELNRFELELVPFPEAIANLVEQDAKRAA